MDEEEREQTDVEQQAENEVRAQLAEARESIKEQAGEAARRIRELGEVVVANRTIDKRMAETEKAKDMLRLARTREKESIQCLRQLVKGIGDGPGPLFAQEHASAEDAEDAARGPSKVWDGLSDPGEGDAWGKVILDGLGLPDGLVKRLAESNVLTMGDVAKFDDAHPNRGLMAIPGIGPAAAEKVSDACMAWHEKHNTDGSVKAPGAEGFHDAEKPVDAPAEDPGPDPPAWSIGQQIGWTDRVGGKQTGVITEFNDANGNEQEGGNWAMIEKDNAEPGDRRHLVAIGNLIASQDDAEAPPAEAESWAVGDKVGWMDEAGNAREGRIADFPDIDTDTAIVKRDSGQLVRVPVADLLTPDEAPTEEPDEIPE
jgi:hypothetical protein